jgi:hypothetical protein
MHWIQDRGWAAAGTASARAKALLIIKMRIWTPVSALSNFDSKRDEGS